jgi:hypothetical protein
MEHGICVPGAALAAGPKKTTNSFESVNLGFLRPCIIVHSNKSTNQMHQSLRFVAHRSNIA